MRSLDHATTAHPLTLVIGAAGKTGRRVAARLEALGHPVRRASRSTVPAFDWTRRATWPAALAGVQRVYVTYQPDLAVEQAQADVRHLIDCCVAAGVTRMVLLSGRGEAGAQACEALALAAPFEVSVVRASWFAQNFDEGHFLGPVLAGTFPLPVDDVAEPFIDVDDIADVAVAALTEAGHGGAVYEVTGPRLLTFPEAIAAIAQASGRAVRFVKVSHASYTQILRDAQVPPDYVAMLGDLMRTVLDGRNAQVADGVQRALGRPPRDFADYAARAAAAGAWAVA